MREIGRWAGTEADDGGWATAWERRHLPTAAQ
jgi:hypothetical protein